MKKHSPDVETRTGVGLQDSALGDIFENALECISRIDQQGNYLSVNSRYAETCGYIVEEMIGMAWQETIHSEDIQQANDAYESMLENGRAEAEIRGIKKDGSQFYQHVVMVKGLDDSDSSISHYCFIQDISEKKQAEQQALLKAFEQARQSEEKFTQVLSASPDAILLLNSGDFTIREVNQAALSLCAYSSDEMIGQTLADLDLFANPSLQGSFDMRFCERKDFRDQDALLCPQQGEKIPVSLSLSHVDINGEPHCILTARDISGRLSREQVYQQAMEAMSAMSSETFFEEAVLLIADKLGVTYSFVTECHNEPADKVSTIAFANNGQLVDNMEYALKGTPCDVVIQGNSLFYREEIRKHFPEDRDLIDLNAESYVAEPLRSSDGEVIGHFALLHTDSLQDEQHIRSILRAFSARAGVELERRQVMLRLQQNETRLRQVSETAQSVIWEVDNNLVHTYVSAATYDVFGTRAEDIIGTSALDYIYPDDKDAFLKQLRLHVDRNESFHHLQVRMFNRDGHVLHLSVSGFPIFGESGEFTGLRGSTQDISKQIHASRELLEQEQQTRLILEQSLDAYIAIDENGIVKQWNLQSEKLFGWSADEAIGTNLTDLIIPYDKHKAHEQGISRYLNNGEPVILNQHLRLEAKHRYGELIPVDLTITPIETEKGLIFSSFLRDMRETIRLEKLEKIKLEIIEQIAGHSSMDEVLELICVKLKQLYDETVRVNIMQVEGDHLNLLAAPDYNESVKQVLDGLIIEEKPAGPCARAVYTGEQVFITDLENDPEWKTFSQFALEQNIAACWSSPVLDHENKIIASITLSFDEKREPQVFDTNVLEEARNLISIILEREKQQSKLKEISDRYAVAVNLSPDGIAITRLADGVILDANEGFSKLANIPLEELIGRSVTDFLYETKEEREKIVKQLISKGSIYGIERRARKPDGKLAYWLQSSVVMEMEGEKCLFSIGQDITERKQQEILRNHNNQILEDIAGNQPFQSILNKITTVVADIDSNMMCAIRLLDKSGQYLLSGASYNIPDFFNDAIIGSHVGKGIRCCGEAAYTGQRMIVSDVDSHPNWSGSHDLTRKLGIKACWSQPIISSDKKILGTFAIHCKESREPDEFESELMRSQAYLASIAIEKNRASEVLQERETTLTTYFNTATESIVVARLSDGRIINVNEGFEKITGYSRDMVIGKTTIELGMWLDSEKRTRMVSLLNEQGHINNMELDFRIRDGSITTALMSATLLNFDDEPCVMSISRDITSWRQMQQALEKSEQRLHTFTMTSPDPIFLTRLSDGTIVEVNRSFEEITGFSQEEIAGKTTVEIGLWPRPEDRQHFVSELQRQGSVQNLEIQYGKKDGKIAHALISATVNQIDGEYYAFILARDIEDSHQQQQRLKRLNESLLSLGGDVTSNIQKIVATAGELLNGSFALFNRLEEGDSEGAELLHAVGHWNVPPEFILLDKAEGHVCFNLIKSGDQDIWVVNDFHKSAYVKSNPNLKNSTMRTYVGQAVYLDDEAVATLAVVYDYDYYPGALDKEILGILVSALGREEARRIADKSLVNITRGVSASTGEKFFEYLTNYLCVSMNADYALIGSLSNDAQYVKTLAMSERGRSIENVNYDLKGTPCKNLLDGKPVIHTDNVQQLFPEVQSFADADIHGYAGQPLIDSDGKVIGLIAVMFKKPFIRDHYFIEQPLSIFASRATAEMERMYTTQALIKSEEKFRYAFGKAPAGVALVDKEGNLFQANQTISDQLGYTNESLLSLNLLKITHPDHLESFKSEFSRLLQSDTEEIIIESRLITLEGDVIWAEIHASPVFDEHGLFMFAICHILDITDRVLSNERFQRSKRALQVLNNCNHGFSKISNEINLLQYITEVIVSTGHYRMAWIGYCQNDVQKTILPMAHAGYEKGYLDNYFSWGDNPHGYGPAGKCINTKSPWIIRHTETDSKLKVWREEILQRGYVSIAALPIIINARPIGALTIYSSETDTFDSEEVALLQDLTENLSHGIQNIRVKHEREQARKELISSEEKFRKAFSNASMGMAIVNREGIILEANETGHKMLGWETGELSGVAFRDITHPDDLASSLENFNKLWTGELDEYQVERRYLHKDGHSVYTVLNAAIIRTAEGSPEFIVAMVEDISKRREAELALKSSEERFRSLYHDMPSMFFTLDEQGVIQSVNEYGANELGYSVSELIGQPVKKVVHPDDRLSMTNYFDSVSSDPEKVNRIEFRKLKKDGTVIWVRETVRKVTDDKGGTHFIIVCEDISEIQRLSSQLSWQASHDALTGLVNRVEFERRLERVLRSSENSKEDHALCFLDMDQFKVINDTCGHLAGDELLRQVSEVLSAAVRKRDTVARLGGDEFGILMEHCSQEKAREVATSILNRISDFRFTWEAKRFSLGVSIGLVPISGSNETITSILRQADAACYAAKDSGRNRIHIFNTKDKDLTRIRGEMQWVSIINEAIDEDHFVLYKQNISPLFKTDVKSQHFELLLRLRADDGHVIMPGAFMPAAERYNLSNKLDSWVIRACFKWLKQHPSELEQLSTCAINLSGLSISNLKFIDEVLELFDRYEIPGEKICFEITETAAIQNMSHAIKFMQMLKGIGCSFALDDFGSGVSSFSYLKQIPVDYIKIDGSFVRDILTDQLDFEMVRSINDIARVMGIQTIAEFVESDDILKLLKGLGVSYGQGYAIHKPEPLDKQGSNKRSG